MTDILLIQPPIQDFYLTAKRTIPYGLTSIAAALMASGFSVDILDALATSKAREREVPSQMRYLDRYYGRPDCSPFALFHRFKHYGYSFEYIGRQAQDSGAFLVGISSLFTPYMRQAIQTAEVVKAYHPDCKIVLGGHHPTALPQSVMDSTAVDFVVRGEGEAAMPLLARALTKGGRLGTVPGLVYRRPDDTLHVSPPTQIQKPNHFPLPAIHLVNHKYYGRRQGRSMVIVAGRGCPLQCTYCSMGATSFLKFRQRPVASVIEEIKAAADQGDLGFIDFEDENLSLDRRWFLKLLREFRNCFAPGKFELRAMNGLYPPSLDSKLVREMKLAGFKTLNLSLGSSSARQLRRFNRPDVRSDFDRVLKIAEDQSLGAVGYIICAAPFQEAQASISDLLFLAQRRVLAGVSVFYPTPGSRDFELCKKLNLLPAGFAGMRSSALPLSHTTTRTQAVTILRLARILNFIKHLLDKQIPLPTPSCATIRVNDPDDRLTTGLQLLGKFLASGKIGGVTSSGRVYDHHICEELSHQFLTGLAAINIRGTR